MERQPTSGHEAQGGTRRASHGDGAENAGGGTLADAGIEYAAIAILTDKPDEMVNVIDLGLSEHDFTEPMCRTAYRSVVSAWQGGAPLDVLILTAQLSSFYTAGDVTDFTARLMGRVSYASALVGYVKRLRELTMRRGLVAAGELARTRAYDLEADVFEGIEAVTAELATSAMTLRKSATPITRVVDRVRDVWRSLGADGLAPGLVTPPWPEICAKAGSFRAGQLWVIAAREKVGKSRWSMQVAAEAAKSAVGVYHATLEMTEEECVETLAQIDARLSASGVQQYSITGDLRDKYFAKLEEVRAWPYHLDGDTAATIDELRLRIIAHKAKANLGLVVIDYTQLVAVSATRRDNREQELARVSRGMKRIAKEAGVCVVAGSQINADGQTRESRALQQDADKIVWLFRDDEAGGLTETTRIAITQRMGEGVGVNDGLTLRFDKRTACFESVLEEKIVEQAAASADF